MTCMKKVLKFSRSSYRLITLHSFRYNSYSKVHWKTTLLCALTKKQSTYVSIESGTCKVRYLHNNVMKLPSNIMLACTNKLFSYGLYIDSSTFIRIQSANRNILQIFIHISLIVYCVYLFWLYLTMFENTIFVIDSQKTLSNRKLYSHACSSVV